MTQKEKQLVEFLEENQLNESKSHIATVKFFAEWFTKVGKLQKLHARIATLPPSEETAALLPGLNQLETFIEQLPDTCRDLIARIESRHERLEHDVANMKSGLED